jgi:transposase
VTTTPATTSDFAVLPTLQAHLATRQLTPGEQWIDVGYVTSDPLLTSQTEYGIDLIGPVMADQSWQEQAANGFAAAPFGIDWDAKVAICPPGQRSVVWRERAERHGHATVRRAFSKPVGAACASRADGTRAASAPRALRLREREPHSALQAARVRQQTETFKKVDARRAGMEGTMAPGTRTGDWRRSRYIGWVNTRRMHRLLAAALNCMRVAAWLAEIPRTQTRPSTFAALAAAA